LQEDAAQRPASPVNPDVDVDLALRIHSSQEAVAPQALAMSTTTPALPAFTSALPAARNAEEDAAAAHAALAMPRSAVGSSSINEARSAKSRLQEAVAKMKRPADAADLAVEYVTTKEEGPPHDRVFEVTCSVSFGDVPIYTVGTGKSRKGAEEDAASKALIKLPPLPPAAVGSWKSRLQEAVAKMKRPADAADLAIEYVTTKEEGPPHDRVFEVTCSVSFGDVPIYTVGTGKSRKGAEEDAASKAMVAANLRALSNGNFH
jgi:dsRNA-specific ribonuclease